MSAEGHSSAHSAPVVLLVVVLLCALLLTAATCPGSAAVPAEGPDKGMPVLRRAAAAEDEVAYSAVREMTGPEGVEDREVRVRVVSRPGVGMALAPVGDEGSALVVRSSSALESLDERLLSMLQDTYAVSDAGVADLDGRRARVVEAERADGTVAGRFWVDTDTGLLLGRTVYGADGEPALSVRLTGLVLGGGRWPDGETGGAPWGDALTEAERADLRKRGWYLPEYLAWNLRLVDARSTRHAGRRVVHLVYSDGLSQVSVFAQRGKLDTGHSPALRNGYVGTGTGGDGVTPQHDTIFGGDTGQYQSMWQADGFVYTVLADAPAGLASSAVTALPEPGGSGFWARVQRGLSRLGFV
ncbi:transcriptional regulator [Nocardiopsis sp. TSRI0078]|uniref:transcriptional regulator n=1 Tax=unclassified Nocardiopsis TaxID=2649073 RepID=UPI00093D62F8|nr:transcriptional regulator [Nocardiopsis sp. TSRI0078]OKI14977.1 transcriptional regulator [Nocardiopsis sp. TSRI0078]